MSLLMTTQGQFRVEKKINHKIYGHKQSLPSGCALRLRWFMDHKFLSTVVYLLYPLYIE